LDLNGFGNLYWGGSTSGMSVIVVGAAVRDGIVIVILPTAAGVDPNFFVINCPPPPTELVGMVQ
jgi:hypothetical protein